MLLLILVLVLLFGGLGGGYYGWRAYGAPGGIGVMLLVAFVLWFIGSRLPRD